MKNKSNKKPVSLIKKILIVAVIALVCIIISSPAEYVGSAAEESPELSDLTPPPTQMQKPTPSPSPEPTPEPTPAYFEITMIGDCTLASTLYNRDLPQAYGNVVGDDYAYPFAKTVQYFEDDDFTIANLECVLTDFDMPTTKNFVFKSPPEYVNIMTEGSVDFVTLGNNHVLDYGEEGYEDTKQVLDDAGIGYAGRDEWSLYETKSGLLIGVYAVSFGNVAQIEAGVKALVDAGAEFIIAALHWGDEGSYDINNLQLSQGHAAIDAGADIVYGSHPHTLQKIEAYQDGYIFYSMGNWSFGGNTNPRDKDTVIVKLTVMRDIDGAISIADQELIPCASSGETNTNNYQPEPYEPDSEQWNRTLAKLDGSFSGADLYIGYEYGFNEY